MAFCNSMQTRRSSGVYSHHTSTSGLHQVSEWGGKGQLIGGMGPGPPVVLLRAGHLHSFVGWYPLVYGQLWPWSAELSCGGFQESYLWGNATYCIGKSAMRLPQISVPATPRLTETGLTCLLMGLLPAQVWWPPEKDGIRAFWMGISGGPEAWSSVSLEGRVRRQKHDCVLLGDISLCNPRSICKGQNRLGKELLALRRDCPLTEEPPLPSLG